MAIVAADFAGDESMVIRTIIEGYETLSIFVREEGWVAEIWQQDLVDIETARRLGIRAAQRLAEANLAD